MFSEFTLANILVILVIIFISTALHEMMHAYVALRLGDDLAYLQGRITLNPLKHIDPILSVGLPLVMMLLGLTPILAAKPVPINTNRVSGQEMGLALIGVAGPITNLVLAALAAFVIRFGGVETGFAFEFVAAFLVVNVGLFVFNMLPIPPLDGSRLLYAFAPSSVQRVMEQIEGFGILGVVMILTILMPFLSPVLTNVREAIISFLV